MRIFREDYGVTEDVVRIILTDNEGNDRMLNSIKRGDAEHINLSLDYILEKCKKVNSELKRIIVIAENPSSGRVLSYDPLYDIWSLNGYLKGYE